ncbi:MAG: hypothetical protein A3B91_00745 [Candidatus Yanofskybacteria bacterium RIFCSPHIGHO2_02_FULL_41_29]|uniref:Uncharacterized protein n=1 Tax=Candidatus Yanofskybacteria bacterium RIFCSPHIGHO2_01_FULL_41_53 TaxID=1802663 RepID=A0A1F8EJT1_9BACT|nr:MAG: hypothetical protein A2650_00315 [Candidatus Yanofskybacteria bacterium RIFCSPHIGHO2_01_FULL_41_53]OGN12270.1 MAG: hypothetical protein A3B91_00745 [Candidatus Yanofskybacteria bacterium RIFCSPHIGHO2_02_FULL_41_29]OGN18566.1 MAG: hypothetical protein A3F48_03770 [Candidatus Yanofskybacteria bacterium RIFCSPHIGHO2_12_FULL_41_9]OGN23631.1 MAG: hypothetical protein A2916_01570 [Candidatus Yanofskybacteria bacterium RIFCSPLOWO2_01_FULL_41_67]OGN29382.1 MAG: hypothetical protein A3H54_03955 
MASDEFFPGYLIGDVRLGRDLGRSAWPDRGYPNWSGKKKRAICWLLEETLRKRGGERRTVISLR